MKTKTATNAGVNTVDVNDMIDRLAANAKTALEEMMKLDQEAVDRIVQAMALAGLDKHMELARMAVDETGRGVFEDKVTKNIFSTEYVYHSIKYDKTVGVIHENEADGYAEIAEPIGIIAGVTPVTNPTSTTMFKSIISIKARNPIIFAFHPSAQKCSVAAAKTLLDAAIEAGAPKYAIQWVESPSIEATQALMNHPEVALILATGGSGMVKSAYSSGKPALGVGPGNVPCYIEKSANIKRAVTDLILSKTFDNGMICASEQAVIIDEAIFAETTGFMKENGCYFVTPEEKAKLEGIMMKPGTCAVNPDFVGQSADTIAKMAGFTVPAGTKIIVIELEGVGPDHPLSAEKLSPVLSCIKVKNSEEGISRAEQMTFFGGMGHSSVIHSTDNNVINAFANRLKTGRLIVNSPATHGAIGDIYNTLIPSLTLGCGSYGHNSTTANVSARHLINIKRVAKRRVNMQWFKVPNRIYFESGSLQYLEKMPNITRAMIVTDAAMAKLGYVDKVLAQLRKRQDYVHCEIFSEVEPDPSVETVKNGVKMMNNFQPDVIIALGGGSPMDAAKAMWLFYEYPDTNFDYLRQKFLDIRKRVFKFPKLGIKAKMVAIPTTSGTGSEVTSFAVITDKTQNMKYPLADYELTPDVAIIDPSLVMTVPKNVTADTGSDVLTHALEAYVSIMASDFTDALALKAIELVFTYLPRAYQNGADAVAREKMHNASTIAGMAFANAFLGINHSLAHKLGAEFHIPHGRANAVILPHVIRYNATKPTKFVSFPKYERFIADEKYAQIARYLGLPASTTAEGVDSLINAIRGLFKELDMPTTLQECGIDAAEFESKVDWLAERAFEDQCTTANPRLPLVAELAEIYRKAYKG